MRLSENPLNTFKRKSSRENLIRGHFSRKVTDKYVFVCTRFGICSR